MNLSELVFKTNTDELDIVIQKLGKVGIAVQNLTKVQEKAAVDSARADKAAATAQDAQNKAAISGIKLEEAKAKAAADSSKSVVDSADKATAYLQRMTDKIEAVKQGWSTGQAAQIAYAKSLGIVNEALDGFKNNLSTLRSIVGGDPFDKSLGALTAVTNRVKVLDEATVLYNANLGLTKKQTRELAQDKMRLDAILESEIAAGKNLNEVQKKYNATLEESQRKYIAMAHAENEALTIEKQHETAIKNSAQANAFLDKEMRRAANAADDANKALGRATSNGLFRFQEALNKSGLTLEQQKKKLDEYKASLAALDKISRSGGGKTDYISRAIGPQITDIVVGLSTGQSPLTVMLQQGGQLRDQLAMNKVAAADMAATMSRAAREMVESIKSVAIGMGGLLVNIVKDSAIGIGNIAAKVLGLNKALDILTQYTLRIDAMFLGTTNLTKVVDALGVAFRVAFGTGILLAITALVIIGVELFKVMQASTGLSQALNLSGASMGTTVSNLKDLSHAMADTGKTSSYLMEGFAEIAKAGVFTRKEFEGIARSAIEMERYVGVAFKDTVENFKQLKGDPLKTLEDLGKVTGLVSYETLESVRALVLQGKTAEATVIALKAMQDVNASIAANAAKDMSPMDLAWIKIKESVARATAALLDFVSNMGKFKLGQGDSNLSKDLVLTAGLIGEAFDQLNNKLASTNDLFTFDNAKKNLTELLGIAEKIARYMVSAPGGRGLVTDIGRVIAGTDANLPSANPVTNNPSVNIRGTVDAQQGVLDTAEQLRVKYALLATAAQFWGKVALEALTPVQKAEQDLNILKEKAMELSMKLRATGNEGVPRSLQIQIDASIAKAERVLAAARFAETSPALRPLSSVNSSDYDKVKAAYEAEISLLQASEKQKLDILKTAYDENKKTTLQYVSEKLVILENASKDQLAAQARELDALGKQAAQYNEEVVKTRDILIAAEARSGETPDKILARQKKIYDDAEKQMQDFSAKYFEHVEKINAATEKLELRLPAEQEKALAEYGKVLKALAAELDAFNVVEKKHQETLAADKALNSKLLWATDDQVGIIKAQADATKFYIADIEKLQESARKAQKQLFSLFDSTDGPPNMSPEAIKVATDAWVLSMNNANEAIATRDRAIKQAGVDAAIAYEEQQRAILAGKIADALTTALFEGGKAGSKKLREIIVAELKKPIIIQVQALVNTLFGGTNGSGGLLNSLLGSAGGGGGGSGGGSSLLSLLGGASSVAGTLASIGSGITTVGSALGLTSVAGFGMGLGGTATLAGSTALSFGVAGASTGAAVGAATAAGGAAAGIGTAVTAVLAAIPVYGWIALAVIAAAAYFGGDETGIKIDNNTNGVGNPSSHFTQNTLAAYDVSGDLPASTFQTLIDAVNKYDKVLVDSLLSPEQTAAIRAKLGSLINPDWFGFDGDPAEAIGKASKDFLQTRYGAVFDEIDAKIAASIRSFKGNAEELLKYIGENVAVMELLKDKALEFSRAIGGALSISDLSAVQKEGESLIQTLDRVVTVFGVTNLFADLMGKSTEQAFGVIGIAGLEARERLIKAAGGIQAFTTALDFYAENFLSETERKTIMQSSAQKTIEGGFAALGLAIPKSRDAFKELVASIDTTTEAGATLLAALLQLAPALNIVMPKPEEIEVVERADGSFYNENFFNKKEQENRALLDAQLKVSTGFAELGLTIPTTKEAFRAYVESIDTTTVAGLTLYNALMDLAPAVDRINPGRADTAFYKANFYSDEERRQAAVGAATMNVVNAFKDLGIAIPNSKGAFREFIEGIDQSTAAGKKFYDAMIALAPDFVAIFKDAPQVKDQGFFRSNFYSQQERDNAAQQEAALTMTASFSLLGLAVPKTREEFKALVDSIDVTTEAGVKLKNTLLDLAPAVAAAIPKGIDPSFFNANFYTTAEQQALAAATGLKTVTDALNAIGVSVPRSRLEFRAYVEAIDRTTEAGEKFYQLMLSLAPAFFDATAEAALGETRKPRATTDAVEVETLAGMAQSSIESLFRTVISSATDAEDARIKGTKAAGEMFFDSIMTNLLGQVSSLVMSAIIEPMSSGLLNATRLAGVTTIDTSVVASNVTQTAAIAAGNTSITASSMAGSAVVAGGAVAGAAIEAAVDKIVATIDVLSGVFASPEFQAAYGRFTTAIGTLSSHLYTAAVTYPGYNAPTGSSSSSGDSASNDPKSRYQAAYDLLLAAINKERDLAKARLDLVSAILETTLAAIKTLKASVEPVQGDTYKAAREFISQAAVGVAAGILPDPSKYQDAVDSAVNGVMNQTYATKFDEQMAKIGLIKDLEAISNVLGPEKTNLEKQLAYLDRIAELAKSQFDALTYNTTVVLSLAQAIANWADTTGTGLMWTAPVQTTSPAPSSFSSPPVSGWSSTYGTNSTNNANSDNSLVNELQLLRNEVIMLRAEVRADVTANQKTAKILERVSQDSDTFQTTVV